MITDKAWMDNLLNIAKQAGNVSEMATGGEAVLTGLLNKKDEMPDGAFDQLNTHLKKIRDGKAQMKEEIKKMEKELEQNGSNTSK